MMVYVCRVGDGPDLRLFPDLHRVPEEDDTDFLALNAELPCSLGIPQVQFMQTTKDARRIRQVGEPVGEFEIMVTHPVLSRLRSHYVACILVSENRVCPTPADEEVKGLGPALDYIRARQKEILAELRQAFALAELVC
jgi:hypothetical protein